MAELLMDDHPYHDLLLEHERLASEILHGRVVDDEFGAE